MDKLKYFKVVAKCGHVGRYNCLHIEFAVVAHSKKEASAKIKNEGRVKRNHKDFILSNDEITFNEFMELRAKNDNDPYLHCKNIQQQRNIQNFKERVLVDEYNCSKETHKTDKRDSKEYRKMKLFIQEKSMMNNLKEYYTGEAL